MFTFGFFVPFQVLKLLLFHRLSERLLHDGVRCDMVRPVLVGKFNVFVVQQQGIERMAQFVGRGIVHTGLIGYAENPVSVME